MDFPHLKDTNFPDINGVNVYKYQNNFDYARWQGKVNYKLINVKWNSVYNDVPYFNTVEERDAWFDSQEGYIDTLESVFNNTPKNSLKVPLPFNDAYHYNYIIIDMPIQTSERQPINYANDSMRVKRWFYFIEDMNQLSPSTTELQLSIDYWTTFVNTVSIPYLMLERGHAPMMQTTVNQYLANPIENNEYLLADDFNYGKEMSRVADSIYKPIGNGKKYVLFACPYSQSDFANFGGTEYSGNSTPPTFANTSERWGYQLTVNDYAWKYGNTDYSNANLPIEGFLAQDNRIFNGTYVYAIDSKYASAFFNLMAHKYVHFMHGIQSVFILDESMFNRGAKFTFHNYTIYNTKMTTNIDNIQLTKEMFNYGEHYEDIVKLYTAPYSYLEFTDDNGNSFDMRIELCGSLKLHKEISLAFPYLRYNVFLTGVNGNTTNSYTWKNIADSNVNKTMWEDDFSKFMMNWDIPTYSVYISSENEFAANNAAGMKARREGAIVAYQNADRYANTGYENTEDNTSTTLANINRTEAGIMQNTQDTADTNEYIVDTLQYAGSTSVAWDGGSGGFVTRTAGAAMKKVTNELTVDTAQLNTATLLDNDTSLAVATNNASAAVISGNLNSSSQLVNSMSNAFSQAMGGSITGLASGVATGISGAYQSSTTQMLGVVEGVRISQNAQYYVDRNGASIQQNIDYGGLKIAYAIDEANGQLSIKKDYDEALVETQNDLLLGNTSRFSNASTGINNVNAAAIKYTTDNNADWARKATVVNEQENLRQKQREAEAQYKNARLQRPTLQGAYSGDAYPDIWQRRGIRLNIRTQSKSAIAQAGDAMLRFGYALHRVWDMDNGFHYGKNFTYWKAEDIWINDGTGVANVATNAIANILLSGVTVWKDPDKIGTIGIYDNI